MNKKLIRLTESDLHRIVKESVNKVLNEIGDKSRKNQGLLGALRIKKFAQGDMEGEKEVTDYAYRQQMNMFNDDNVRWTMDHAQNAYNLNANLHDAHLQGYDLALKYYRLRHQVEHGDITEDEYRMEIKRLKKQAKEVPNEKYFDLQQGLKSMKY